MVGGEGFSRYGWGNCEAPKGPLQLLWWAGAKRPLKKGSAGALPSAPYNHASAFSRLPPSGIR